MTLIAIKASMSIKEKHYHIIILCKNHNMVFTQFFQSLATLLY